MQSKIKSDKPFEHYTVYKGFNRNTRRFYIKLYRNQKDYRVMNYSRYLMSVKLGYEVPKNMDVHHINGDKYDDRIENLELLTVEEHANRTTKEINGIKRGQELAIFNCPYCEIEVTKLAKDVRADRKRGRIISCSKQICITYIHKLKLKNGSVKYMIGEFSKAAAPK